ncbi:helix-turn-helix transcriptional regulator, partial [Nocardia gipuzkoensis]
LLSLLRGYVTAGPLAPVAPKPLPGVVVVGADNAILGRTSAGWAGRLEEGGAEIPTRWLVSVVAGLAIQARRHAEDPRAAPALLIGPSARYGRWIATHARPLEGGAPGQVAVVIEAACGDLLLPSICDWYEVSTRERQVLQELRTGAATKQIARTLDLSAHTVNDHLKSIYRKIGCDGRDELLAALSG